MWNKRRTFMLLALVIVVLVAQGLRQPDEFAPVVYVSEVSVELTPQQAWQRLSDLSVAHHYVPGIVKTEITTTTRQGMDVSRRVYSSTTEFINETVIVWEEGSGFTLRLHDENDSAPAPFKRAHFSYRLAPASDGASKVQLELSVVMRGGTLGDWLARTVLAKALQERTDVIAQRLKNYYESPDSVPDLKRTR